MVAAFLFIGALSAHGMVGALETTYGYRWPVNAVAGGTVVPPWRLDWERSPVWFNRLNPGGRSESPGRRIAEGPDGLVSVMKRTLYVLDRTDGGVIWSRGLPGTEIVDWKMSDGTFLYTALDYGKHRVFRGAIDLKSRRDRWSHDEAMPQRYEEEMLLPAGELFVIASKQERFRRDEIVGFDRERGTVRWRADRRVEGAHTLSFVSFVYRGRVYFLVAPKAGGLYLRGFEVADGTALPLMHIYGKESLGNLSYPVAVTANGTLVIGYSGRPSRQLALIAFSLEQGKLLWSTSLKSGGARGPLAFFKNVVDSPAAGERAMATIYPNRFVTFDPVAGGIERDRTLPDDLSWTDTNAMLYSPPYLFAGVRRVTGRGFAYDLIALNTGSGNVEWSHGIDEQSETFSTSRAEILNFIVKDKFVHVGRADSRVMSFEARQQPSRRD